MNHSLLEYVDSPIVVGDPEGRAAYVNPAFERHFGVDGKTVRGELLSSLFDGGTREAVLFGVARVCQSGAAHRFRVRTGTRGYAVAASPIDSATGRVGFVMLFVETSTEDEHLQAVRRRLRDPVEQIAAVLAEVLEQTGGDKGIRYRDLLENGLREVGRLRRSLDDLDRLLSGQGRGN